jgi:glucose/arabinose dehydrogenase
VITPLTLVAPHFTAAPGRLNGMRSARMLVGGAVCAVALAGCAAGAAGTGPNWTPKPSFSGEGYAPPADPQPVQPAQPSSGTKKQGDPAVVAKHLTTPVGITIMPDNTALVGERTTGRIVRVQAQPDRPVRIVRVLHGLSTAGGGGLLDLAVSPNYREDNLIFAYVTTHKDNRVVAFTLGGPVTPVLTGIPRGRTGNAGRLTFAADGSLLIGTGDAGTPSLAENPRSLAGKVLRVSDIGRPAQGNPTKGSRVFATGIDATTGLCTASDSTLTFQVGAMPNSTADPVYQVEPGRDYASAATVPAAHLPDGARAPGGCAVLRNALFVTSLDGQELLSAKLSAASGGGLEVSSFSPTLHKKYGRLRTVVAAPDGALWLSTSNRDGHGKPAHDDERILRIVPTGGGGNNPL